MKPTKPAKATRAQLERQIMELRAQLAHVYGTAVRDIDKAGEALTASGALLQLHALGGREIIPPVVIRDGLSAETIAALKRDLARSYELAVANKPKSI